MIPFGIDDERVIFGKDSVIRRRFRLSRPTSHFILTYEWNNPVNNEWIEESYPFGDNSPDLYATQERFNVRRCLFFQTLQKVRNAPNTTFLIYSGNSFR